MKTAPNAVSVEPAKPRVYMAGKIYATRDDWRPITGDQQHLDDPTAIARMYDASAELDCDDFVYIGPFSYGCDHGDAHGNAEHGAGISAMEHDLGRCGCIRANHPEIKNARQVLFETCKARVLRADVVLAYIDSADAFGTFIEIGFANAAGVPVYIGVSDSMDQHVIDDMWFILRCAKKVYRGEAAQVLYEFGFDVLGRR